MAWQGKVGHGMDITVVASQFIEISPSGSRFIAFCPFHHDVKTPSLVIYPETNSWYCFGCGRGGGIMQFLVNRGMSYQQAKQWIELREGRLSLPRFKPQFKPKKVAKPSHTVVDYWYSLLGSHREYFRSRMLTNETVDKYRLGWTGSRYSIPFWSGDKIVSVQSRRNGSTGPKYMWELGSQPRIFGSSCLSENEKTFVFFSTLDALLAGQDGFNAVAVPGQTVGVSGGCWEELSAKAVDALGFRDMVIVPDRGEEAMGYKLAHRLNCGVWEWPEGTFTDYCEFRQHHSIKDFKEIVGG